MQNMNDIATPKTYFQEAKLHKTYVTTTVNMVYYQKSYQLNTVTNIIWSSKECQDKTNAKYEWYCNSKNIYFQGAKLHKTHVTP